MRASALVLGGLSPDSSSKKSNDGPKKSMLGISNAAIKKSTAFLSNSINNSALDPSGALKKSTMVLSQLAGAMDHGKRPITDTTNINSATGMIENEIITATNLAQSDRPQIWTKSTTKSADTNYERRKSLLNSSAEGTSNQTRQKKKKASMSLTGDDLKDMIQNINTLESRRTSISEDYYHRANQSSKKISLENSDIAESVENEEMGSNSSLNSKASLLVENLIKNINNLGKPLRGPILIQLALLYVSYLLILFVAWYSNWTPHIQFFATFAYFALSCIAIQVGRLAYSIDIGSVIPLYISLFPFAGIIFISRESHQEVFVLWFASLSFIFLQSGHPFLRLHFLAYCTLMFIVYILAIFSMSRVYDPACDYKVCGEPLYLPISVSSEAVMLANSFFCILIMLSLEWFIKLNALELLERDTYMNQLVQANEALIKQLKGKEEEPGEISLEVPLTRATNILKQVKEDQTIDRIVADEIDFILGILSQDSHKLFVPDLYQKPADADVHDWLNDMMLTDKNPNNISSVVIAHKKEDPMLDQALLMPEDGKIFNFLSKRLDDPEFDIFELYNMAKGKVLYYIGWHIFRKYEYATLYGMNELTFRRWLSAIETGYLTTNPYHNALHAADVTHSMHYYVSRSRIWDILRPEEKMAVLIAPIIHDYKHPGLNNAYMISTRAPLAIRYNDSCVLENYHVASVYELMLDDTYNIIEHLAPESRKIIREMTVSMVLATDMAVHFEWIGKFKSKLSGAGLNLETKQDRKLLLNMAMKCADINNPTKKSIFSRKWTDMIMREFFAQGEEEKKRGLKVTMFMDKDTTDIPKCQVVSVELYS